MNDEPTAGLSSPPGGDSPTRDQVPPESSPPLPDLSVAVGGSTSRPRSAPEPPKLDGYDVVCSIGEGGMGTVWRGLQHSTKRNVALKLISAAGFASERARQRFDREVEITARLEHPNIARVYDSGINRGVYFYAMELIDGLPLDQFVSQNELNVEEILRLFALVCRAVEHAHHRDVIHRDLKPGNILVTRDGQPHVLDFGLAKALLQAGKEAGISLDGEVAGTPGYMSPEQAAGRLDIDARCDVYSLGVILYRLLTGESPHDLSGTYLDILRRVSEEEPKRPRIADPTMDRELEALLLHAIQREPAQRYKTAGQLARDIENYLAGDPLTAKTPTTIYFLRKRVHKHRVKLVTAATVLVLISLATALTVRLIHSRRFAGDETRKKEQESLKKFSALASGAISKGDTDLAAGNWSAARENFQNAADHFAKAGAPAIKADLALWDLERTAPAPVAFIPAIANVALTAGPAVVADGHIVLGGFADGTIRRFDLPHGGAMQSLLAEKMPIRSIAASADGKLAITGSENGSVKLWNLSGGSLFADLRNEASPLKNRVTHVAISPDKRLAVTVSGMTPDALSSPAYNDTVTLWDIAAYKPLFSSDRDGGVLAVNKTVTQIVFSPDSAHIAVSSADVSVWNVSDGKRATGSDNSATAIAFSADGNEVVAGAYDGAIRLLDLHTAGISTLPQRGAAISAVAFNRARGEIVSVKDDGSFRGMTVEGGEMWNQPPRGDVNAAFLSSDGKLAATATDEGISIWRMAPSQVARDIATSGPFTSAFLSSDGRLVAARSARREASTPSADGLVLFDAKTGNRLAIADIPTGHCDALALSQDGKHIAILSGESVTVCSTTALGDIKHFSVAPPRDGNSPAVLAISADGARIAVGNGNNLAIHHVTTAAAIAGKSPITAAVFSGNGHILLTACQDQTADAWNADSGASIATLRGHQAPVNAVAISDDGMFAVTASGGAKFAGAMDNSVRIWLLPEGTLIRTISAHATRVRSVAISGNGRLIASGGDDQTIIISDLATGETLRSLHTTDGPVLSLSFDETGQMLAVGADKLSLWDFGWAARMRASTGHPTE